MSADQTPPKKPTCFVVMGFGKKTDFQTGRLLDLDKSYRTIIKPAALQAGLECVRADEIVHSGIIDVPMYRQLLTADVVIADLSAYNANAFYELGVRHALKPFSTITIAESKLVYPFDVSHIVIRPYEHLGAAIDAEEAQRMVSVLVEAIKTILQNPANDSPVYEFLNDLQPPSLLQKVATAIAKVAAQVTGDAPATAPEAGQTVGFLRAEIESALHAEDWPTAKSLLTTVRKLLKDPKGIRPEDPYIIQQLALATYKSKKPSPQAALEEALAIAEILNPKTTNDPETLGLCGAINKRLWEVTGQRANLDSSIGFYERGFTLRSDYYNGINFAYLLNVRASVSNDPDDAIADSVQAKRVRAKVVELCEALLVDEAKLTADDRYWILATLAEAWCGLGEEAKFVSVSERAYSMAPKSWMKGSTEEQIGKLKGLLAKSPTAHALK